MPGTTTHNYILYRALKEYGSGSAAMSEIQESHETAHEYGKLARGKKPDNPMDQDMDLAGCAYVGCCGPDLFYLDLGSTGTFVADLLHYNRSGLYMIWWLRELKQSVERLMDPVLGRNLQRQYSYILGHIAHIAADITIHPYVNSIVQAYPSNLKVFENSRGWNKMNLWKFHNILEHHQDAYVLYEKFQDEEGFNADDWENINVARHAADYFMLPANVSQYFIVRRSRDFYRYATAYGVPLEQDKYRFFNGGNYLLLLSTYYEVTIPNRATTIEHRALVQASLFEKYLASAIAMAKAMFTEAETYLQDTGKEDFTDPEMRHAKKFFPNLRRHWNLDCGLAPAASGNATNWDVPTKQDTKMCIAGTLRLEPANGSATWDDIVFPLPAGQ